jgi:membrane-associated phospholipid phosphatase
MIRPEINGNDVFDLLVKFIYKADAKAVNCFPSIHAIIGTTMIIGGYKTNKFSKKLQITSIICGIGCTISTVFVKQHYFVDMVVGTLIMIVFYSLILWIDKKRDIKK